MSNRDWMASAICRQYDPETFFPSPINRRGTVIAQNICRQCPVQIQCATFAATINASYGIWAGQQHNHPSDSGHLNRVAAECGTEAAYARHRRRGETPCRPCTEASAKKHRARRGGWR